jgi:hypothetical protein
MNELKKASNPYCFILGFVAGMFTITGVVLVAELVQLIDILNVI